MSTFFSYRLRHGAIMAILIGMLGTGYAKLPAYKASPSFAANTPSAHMSMQQAHTPDTIHDTIYVIYSQKSQIPGYMRDRKPANRHEITIGYVFLPATEFMVMGRTYYNYHSFQLSMCGATQAGYCYRFTKVIGVGLHYIFNPAICKIYNRTFDLNNLLQIGKANISAHTIMPSLKINWLNRNIVVMYSQVGMGITFRQQKIHNYFPDMYDITPYSKHIYFAYQFTLIGIELGNKQYSAYLHLGAGMEGFLAAGFRLGL